MHDGSLRVLEMVFCGGNSDGVPVDLLPTVTVLVSLCSCKGEMQPSTEALAAALLSNAIGSNDDRAPLSLSNYAKIVLLRIHNPLPTPGKCGKDFLIVAIAVAIQVFPPWR